MVPFPGCHHAVSAQPVAILDKMSSTLCCPVFPRSVVYSLCACYTALGGPRVRAPEEISNLGPGVFLSSRSARGCIMGLHQMGGAYNI